MPKLRRIKRGNKARREDSTARAKKRKLQRDLARKGIFPKPSNVLQTLQQKVRDLDG